MSSWVEYGVVANYADRQVAAFGYEVVAAQSAGDQIPAQAVLAANAADQLRVDGRMGVILRPRGQNEIGERNGEYRHAEEEDVDDPLRLLFAPVLVRRKCHPFWHDVSARRVFSHLGGPSMNARPRGYGSRLRRE